MIYKNMVERGVFFMTVSQRILEIMENKHIKQKTLADYTGISTSAISDWKKKGTNPSVDKIVAISECLGVSVDYLLGRVDEPTQYSQVTYPIDQKDIKLSSDSNTNKPQKVITLDETTTQVAEMFSKLNLVDKTKVLSLMVELSQK